MGHRALVAYGRPDGRYDLHYSHWGAERLRLAGEITPRTPFGARGTDGSTAVDPEPTAAGIPFEEIIDGRLDFLCHEALYTVSPAGEVTAYRTLWFGFGDDATVGNGALVEVPGGPVEDAYVRGWFQGVKTVAADLLDRGGAVDYLADAVSAFAGERDLIVVADRA
jgi:hypothetical protein